MRKFMFLAGVAALVLLGIGCAGKGKKEEVAEHGGHGAVSAEKKATKYHCPMHPSYISDKPGDCPICGMKLVPIEAHEEGITVSAPGLAGVKISPERQQLIGVKTGVVTRRPLDRTIRTVGRVDYDERKVAHIHTRTEGWIKQLFANYTGQLVRRHQPLFTIYSPELVATQEEYLLALRAKKSLQDNAFQDVASGSASLLEAARRRLLLWEMTEEQIAGLERTGKPLMEVAIASHGDGFVVEKKALEGMRVEPGEDLYTIADLSDVWVHADIYENDLAQVRAGQEATVTLNAYPGEAFRGQVVYIYPDVEPQTRTARVRIELPNPGWKLKPGMFTDVEIRTTRGEGLVVPGGAVLDSGERKVVFVDRGEGRFEPREVKLGGRAGEDYEVIEGLSEGERVITSANFLIDSESQIKAALGAMGGIPMINRIIEYCATHKFIVFVFAGGLVMAGLWAMRNVPLDAIPDLSDTQVIIYSRWDRSPDIMEDQVTYPIISSMPGVPKVKSIRGFSDFAYSYVYIIFEDGTDIYWARSRTLEYLSNILPKLPQGVNVELGRDATAVGWVFQYALVDTTGQNSLADLRSYQDWYLRYYLQAVPGVSEVAPIGGFVRQYQVNVDPNALKAYNIPIDTVVNAVRKGNNDVGGRLVEFSGREDMVRGRGYAKSVSDLEKIVVGVNAQSGTPVLVRDLGTVSLGPDIRRGVAELDGKGETVGGIVVMRQGENALKVIDRVKAKLKEVEPTLPKGVEVVTTYDRSELIDNAIETLTGTLVEEMAVVSLVILLFLWHLPSAMIPIVTIPVAVVLSFIPMYYAGVTSNIMSLGGIAIAIGSVVDAAIVVVEQTHKKLEEWDAEGRKEDYQKVVISAIKEVGGPSFFSLLVIAVSFMPVFTLEAQEGRLFKPLAFTNNLSVAIAAVLAITLDPAMRMVFTHARSFNFSPRWFCRAANAVLIGKIHKEEHHPISRAIFKVYTPAVSFVLRHQWAVVTASFVIVLLTIPAYVRLGSEFMPPLYEGSILYMPTTMPGLSVGEATSLLRTQDRVLKSFPEVERVFGKAGRAETATDPAPFSMMETTVILKPVAQWRPVHRWYSDWAPGWLKGVLRRFWPDHITPEQLISEMDRAMKFPGVSNAWTMPIKGRIDMLTTGVRTPVGIKVQGADLKKIQEIGEHIETVLKGVAGTRSVFAERTAGGYFLDFDLKRDALARYGLSVDEAQMHIVSVVGGENITTTVEGRERYPVNVRYLRDYRSSLDQLSRVLVSTPGGAQVPIAQLADIRLTTGPAMIRDENGMLSGYVYVDVADRDIGSYVADAKKVVLEKAPMPPGYTLVWSGQYEAMERVKERMWVVIPLTLFIVFVLIHLNTGSLAKTGIVLLAVPFSAVGAVWLLVLLGYNMSIGVWVGLIALMGVDAETGVFMLLYLDLAYEERKGRGLMRTWDDLREAILHGAVRRVRPKFMTVAVSFVGLLPVMWSTGAGSDVMKRIAAPMVGGIFTSFLMELLVYPAIYAIWRGRELRREA